MITSTKDGFFFISDYKNPLSTKDSSYLGLQKPSHLQKIVHNKDYKNPHIYKRSFNSFIMNY